MDIKTISPSLSVSPQILPTDMAEIASLGFKAIISNRPDKESDDQPLSDELAAEAASCGIHYEHIPIVPGQLAQSHVDAFKDVIEADRGPVLAFCRTGTRSITLWALHAAESLNVEEILKTTGKAGYDLTSMKTRLQEISLAATPVSDSTAPSNRDVVQYEVVIVGGGSAGLATAASLLRRRPALNIAIIEPGDRHYYQPGFTLVGGGVFDPSEVAGDTADIMPESVRWIRATAATFEPESNRVVLEDGSAVGYKQLVVAPGIKLDWDAIPGLRDTLGKNGVTSNYRYDLAPYTWELVMKLKKGRAIFTQPPMPIKCAGAPQKAMYLSCDHWFRNNRLKNIEVDFCNAGGVLFGVETYVPALMKYVKKYDAKLNFSHNLVKIDGDAKKAWFDCTVNGETERKVIEFDMIHVCPPQTAPDFIRQSALADEQGWIDVAPDTLRHVRYANIFGLGDACNAPNAKTMAAARKQAPVVASNVIAALRGQEPRATYDGYGSCPLMVERGKVILAEFGYGGKLLPSFPRWLNDGTRPTRFGWFLKQRLLPTIYYKLMLKGREWLATPGSASVK